MREQNIHILMIDDDEDDYLLTRELLAEIPGTRMNLSWQATYEEGRQALLNKSYDVCLLDYRLDTGSGLELIGETLKQGCTVPIIVLTGLADREIDLQSMEAGAADFLVKGELTAPLLERSIRYVLDRARSAEQLRLSELRYRRIFESIQDIFFENLEDGTILDISPSVEQILNYRREELLGTSVLDLYATPLERNNLLEQLHRHGAVNDYEISLKNREGVSIPSSVSCRLIAGDSATPDRIIGTLRDIRERKQAEEQEARYEARLRRAQKLEAIGTLAGGIAHDFNNVLAAIMGYTELVRDEVADPRHRANLEQVLRAGTRARDLIRQILTFSRQLETERTPVQVHLIVKEALKLLRSSIPSSIEISADINPDCGLVLADPTQIHQVVVNICTNAAQAMETDSTGVLQITLTSRSLDSRAIAHIPNIEAGEYLVLTVSDSGRGMDESTRERIFEPFFTTRSTGTGLGLATAHGIVTDLEGTITVDNHIPRGTTFTVYLPRLRSPQQEQIVPRKEDIPQGGGEHILLVDDESMILNFGRQMLSRLGYRVSTHTAGADALASFRAAPLEYDLVITDQSMPRMTGLELIEEIRHLRPDMPVILTSGFARKATSTAEAHITAFLSKPFSKQIMAETVARALGRIQK